MSEPNLKALDGKTFNTIEELIKEVGAVYLLL